MRLEDINETMFMALEPEIQNKLLVLSTQTDWDYLITLTLVLLTMVVLPVYIMNK